MEAQCFYCGYKSSIDILHPEEGLTGDIWTKDNNMYV